MKKHSVILWNKTEVTWYWNIKNEKSQKRKEAFLSPIVTKSNNVQEIKYLYDMHNLNIIFYQ
jgi:hypothetical protein